MCFSCEHRNLDKAFGIFISITHILETIKYIEYPNEAELALHIPDSG